MSGWGSSSTNTASGWGSPNSTNNNNNNNNNSQPFGGSSWGASNNNNGQTSRNGNGSNPFGGEQQSTSSWGSSNSNNNNSSSNDNNPFCKGTSSTGTANPFGGGGGASSSFSSGFGPSPNSDDTANPFAAAVAAAASARSKEVSDDTASVEEKDIVEPTSPKTAEQPTKNEEKTTTRDAKHQPEKKDDDEVSGEDHDDDNQDDSDQVKMVRQLLAEHDKLKNEVKLLRRNLRAANEELSTVTNARDELEAKNAELTQKNELLEIENEVLTEQKEKATLLYKQTHEVNIRALENTPSSSQLKAMKKEKEEFEQKSKAQMEELAAKSEQAKKDTERVMKEKEAKDKELARLQKEVQENTPKRQILNQYGALCRLATAEVEKLVGYAGTGGLAKPWLSSGNFRNNQCLQDECSLLDKITASDDANFKQIIKAGSDPWAPSPVLGDLSGQFELAFHGTSHISALKILCEGLDPNLRAGQAFGPGEYFGEFTQQGLNTAQGYVKGALLLVLLVKAGKVKRPGNSMIIVDNPSNSATFCLPIGVYFQQHISPIPTRQCSCALQAPTRSATNNPFSSSAPSSSTFSSNSTNANPFCSFGQQQQWYPVSKKYTRVQFHDDNGGFSDMSPHFMSFILSKNSHQQQNGFSLQRFDAPSNKTFNYTYDLSKMQQTNTDTGRVRMIRFV